MEHGDSNTGMSHSMNSRSAVPNVNISALPRHCLLQMEVAIVVVLSIYIS